MSSEIPKRLFEKEFLPAKEFNDNESSIIEKALHFGARNSDPFLYPFAIEVVAKLFPDHLSSINEMIEDEDCDPNTLSDELLDVFNFSEYILMLHEVINNNRTLDNDELNNLKNAIDDDEIEDNPTMRKIIESLGGNIDEFNKKLKELIDTTSDNEILDISASLRARLASIPFGRALALLKSLGHEVNAVSEEIANLQYKAYENKWDLYVLAIVSICFPCYLPYMAHVKYQNGMTIENLELRVINDSAYQLMSIRGDVDQYVQNMRIFNNKDAADFVNRWGNESAKRACARAFINKEIGGDKTYIDFPNPTFTRLVEILQLDMDFLSKLVKQLMQYYSPEREYEN